MNEWKGTCRRLVWQRRILVTGWDEGILSAVVSSKNCWKKKEDLTAIMSHFLFQTLPVYSKMLHWLRPHPHLFLTAFLVDNGMKMSWVYDLEKVSEWTGDGFRTGQIPMFAQGRLGHENENKLLIVQGGHISTENGKGMHEVWACSWNSDKWSPFYFIHFCQLLNQHPHSCFYRQCRKKAARITEYN